MIDSMELKCPRCNSLVAELIECDSCNTIGCIKCVRKYNKQWVCDGCKSSNKYLQETVKASENLFSMFG